MKTELNFKAKIFSLNSRDEFLQYLAGLDESAAVDVRAYADEIYGLT